MFFQGKKEKKDFTLLLALLGVNSRVLTSLPTPEEERELLCLVPGDFYFYNDTIKHINVPSSKKKKIT